MSRPIPPRGSTIPTMSRGRMVGVLYQHWNDHLLQCEQHVPLRTLIWSRRQESNLYLPLRRRPFYPLNYGERGGGLSIYL